MKKKSAEKNPGDSSSKNDDRESTWKKMLLELDDDENDGFVPKDVARFLTKTLRLSDFESEKRRFRLGKLTSVVEMAGHVKTAHSLINFWKNMYICASATGAVAADDDDSDASDMPEVDDDDDDDCETVKCEIGFNDDGCFNRIDDGEGLQAEIENDEVEKKAVAVAPVRKKDARAGKKIVDVGASPDARGVGKVDPGVPLDARAVENDVGASQDAYVVDNLGASPDMRVVVSKDVITLVLSSDEEVDDKVDDDDEDDETPPRNPLDSSSDSDVETPPPKAKRGRKPTGSKRFVSRSYALLRKLRCRLCDGSLTSFDHMMETHGTEFASACPLCEEGKIDDIVFHVNVAHLGKTALKCDSCSYLCFEPSEYERHRRAHVGVKKIKCRLCPLWFPDGQRCRDHAETEHPAGKQTLKKTLLKYNESALSESSLSCEICGEAFVGPKYLLLKRLTRHRRHHFPKQRLYKCNDCDKSFFTRPTLTKHSLIHSNVRPYHCSYGNCPKSFKTTGHLRQHKQFHEEPAHVCGSCGKKFFMKATLQKHAEKCVG